MTHPEIFSEIYGLLLKKNFRPEIKISTEPDHLKLYLWSPDGKYFTIYDISADKIKWVGGVLPFRILK